MKTTSEVMKLTGMSKSRCIQFARTEGLQKFGQNFMWTDEDVERFRASIGKMGRKPWKKATERSDN